MVIMTFVNYIDVPLSISGTTSITANRSNFILLDISKAATAVCTDYSMYS